MRAFPLCALLASLTLVGCGASTGLDSSPRCEVGDSEPPLPPQQPPRRGDCHLIGCNDAVLVTLRDARGTALLPARWTLNVDGEHLSGSLCPPLLPWSRGYILCRRGIFTLSIVEGAPMPSVVELTIVTAEGTVAHVCGGPRYSLIQPNGPGCAPICRSGRLSASVLE